MLARSLSFAAALVLAGSAAPATALGPLGDWKIEPSDTQCVAVRKYGTADKSMSLVLKRSLLENSVQVAVLRNGLRKNYVQSNATIGIGDQVFATTALSYPIGGNDRRVAHLINFDAVQYAALRAGSILEMSVREGFNETFLLGQMESVWTALDKCVERVGEIWNVGEERERRFETHAKGDLASLFTAGDYPKVAARSGQQGMTGFLILIDEIGRPKDCTVIQTSGSAAIDSRSCGIILVRAKFVPAMGQDGKPMKSAFRKRVNWRLQR